MLHYASPFKDIDLLRETVKKWNLEVLPLQARGLSYHITQAISPEFMVSEANFSCLTEQNGASPSGFRTFVIPAHGNVEYRWRGHELKGNHLSLFPPNGELHSISNQTFHVYTVSFAVSILNSAIAFTGSSKMNDSLKGENIWHIHEASMQKMRDLARCVIMNSATNQPTNHLQQILLREILVAIRDSEEVTTKSILIKKQKTLLTATNWMKNSIESPRSLSNLYNSLGVSERSVQSTFKTQFGMSLKAYYKIYRLSRVNQALRNARKGDTVVDIASTFGYWHMGQFSKDYKKYIGELPSQTLERSRVLQR